MKKINDWATQWKMSFNPDPTKQAQEVIFSRKIKKPLHIPLNFNNANAKQNAFQKHLGLILDSQLSFEEHLKTIFSKVNKTIGLIQKLRNSLPRPPLMTLYKSLFDLILTMEISFTISHSVTLSKTKLKVSNIMHALLPLVQ